MPESMHVPEITPGKRWILEHLSRAGFRYLMWSELHESMAFELGHNAALFFDEEFMTLQQLGLAKRFAVADRPGVYKVMITQLGRMYLDGCPTGGVVPEPLEALQEELNYVDPGSPEWEWVRARIDIKSTLALGQALDSLRETAKQISAEADRLKRIELWIVALAVLASLGAGVLGALVVDWLARR